MFTSENLKGYWGQKHCLSIERVESTPKSFTSSVNTIVTFDRFRVGNEKVDEKFSKYDAWTLLLIAAWGVHKLNVSND